MPKRKAIMGLALIALVVCSSVGFAAQCTCPQCCPGQPGTTLNNTQSYQAAPATPSAVGQGPAQPGAAINLLPNLTVTPVSQIKQRGHVNNLCEENEMLLTLVRQLGGMETFGDYRVAYLVDKPESWYVLQNGQLVWREPAPGETVHLEAVVLDSLTNKWMPVPNLIMDVIDSQGRVVESHELIMLWHPFADHYGMNYKVPAGTYTLRVHAPVPPMGRHDRQFGQRFSEPIDATFRNVTIPRKP